MNRMVKTPIMIIMTLLTMCMSSTHAGPLPYAACQTGCNALWVACVAAGGGVAGESTGGAAVPAANSSCNAANRICMATCANVIKNVLQHPCQTGCYTLWVACVAAGGGVAGVSTGGAAVPAAISACNAADRICMATSAKVALCAPTP
eukprot:GFUD01026869.1.p1 GENE.GFUD01026869.1~~GFUD01026869.1.p1  ORF type:complete len:148 (-),score=32.29 GFUD01026869.1:168-611(-)